MKKNLPLTLVLIGAALLITAVVFWIDSSASTESQSFGKTLLDWITLIGGLGASIKGWMDLFKKEKPTPPTTRIDVKDGNPQISTGDHARNIQTETYIENQTIQKPPESKTPISLNQLPAPPLDFIGREKELDQLRQNIENGVLISGVQGMGGIGKTALGLKLAEQIVPNFPDGQIFLDLRGANEQMPLAPEQVMEHVIRSFNPEADLPSDLSAMYRSILSHKKALLFYDNVCDEKQIYPLLPPKGCMLFVTSRRHFTLPRLYAVNLDTLDIDDACRLVKEIAPELSDEDAIIIAKQCGYLPLAVRAAVSALLLRPDWSIAYLLQRLHESTARLDLVESSMSLSYDALDKDLQKYLRQLGVFGSPFDKSSLLMVWGVNGGVDADKIIGELMKSSLLGFNKATGNYHFHDLTSLFLEKKFLEDPESNKTLDCYAKSYVVVIKNLVAKFEELEFSLENIPGASYLVAKKINYKPESTNRRFRFSGRIDLKNLEVIHLDLYPINIETKDIYDRSELIYFRFDPVSILKNELLAIKEAISDLIKISNAITKRLDRDDIVRTAKKFYSIHSISLPLFWENNRNSPGNILYTLRKLRLNKIKMNHLWWSSDRKDVSGILAKELGYVNEAIAAIGITRKRLLDYIAKVL